MSIVGWDWGAINQIADNVIITVGIALLIIRQFLWRSAELNRMIRIPVVVVTAGIVYLVVEVWGGFHWVTADWLIIAELALVAITGTAMGHVTHFRDTAGHLQYRLTGAGLILWAFFVAIRVGNFALANLLGANLVDATGLILLSFGVNRLTAIAVVQRRAVALISKIHSENAMTHPGAQRPKRTAPSLRPFLRRAKGTKLVNSEKTTRRPMS